jgi:predicted RNase H-like nuclease (RuvC/YqgF family)
MASDEKETCKYPIMQGFTHSEQEPEKCIRDLADWSADRTCYAVDAVHIFDALRSGLSAAEQAMREALESDGIDADATPRPLHEEIVLLGGSQRALRNANANLEEMLSAAERENERLKSEVNGYQSGFDTQHAEIKRLRAACEEAIDLPFLIGRLEHEHRQFQRLCIENDVAEIVTNLRAALTPPTEGAGG